VQDIDLDSFDSLYDDLVHGGVALSNQEKLQLLQYGCLGGPAGDDLLDWDNDSGDLPTEGDEDDSNGSGSDGDESEQEHDSWREQQQHRIEGDPRGYGEESDVESRHFDKQQVS
jgi:hypothetical protein